MYEYILLCLPLVLVYIIIVNFGVISRISFHTAMQISINELQYFIKRKPGIRVKEFRMIYNSHQNGSVTLFYDCKSKYNAYKRF